MRNGHRFLPRQKPLGAYSGKGVREIHIRLDDGAYLQLGQPDFASEGEHER